MLKELVCYNVLLYVARVIFQPSRGVSFCEEWVSKTELQGIAVRRRGDISAITRRVNRCEEVKLLLINTA